jgi:hypothetical protein
VRVSTAALYSGVRKERKDHRTTKYVPTKWSELTFRVKTRVKKDSPDGTRNTPAGRTLQKFQYTLESLDGRDLLTEAKLNGARDKIRGPARFFASELQKVPLVKGEVPEESVAPQGTEEAVNLADNGTNLRDVEQGALKRKRQKEKKGKRKKKAAAAERA